MSLNATPLVEALCKIVRIPQISQPLHNSFSTAAAPSITHRIGRQRYGLERVHELAIFLTRVRNTSSVATFSLDFPLST